MVAIYKQNTINPHPNLKKNVVINSCKVNNYSTTSCRGDTPSPWNFVLKNNLKYTVQYIIRTKQQN